MTDRPTTPITSAELQAALDASTTPSAGGCLHWIGGSEGTWKVPYFRIRGRKYSARRVAWELANATPAPAHVTTSCGTEGCVAPAHLIKQTNRAASQASARKRQLLPLAERFWAKVQRRGADECWAWTGRLTSAGYGQISRGRKTEGVISAHRLAYELANGPIPDGLIIRHRCDNPVCVNPAHLEVGTYADNMRDRDERGRTASLPGEAHPRARVTDADVREIRRLVGDQMGQRAVAERFGISQQAVSDIVTRRRWRHI